MKQVLFVSLLLIVAGIFGCSEESMVNGPEVSNSAKLDESAQVEEPLQAYKDQEMSVNGNTILDIAAGNPDFSILVKAVQFAGFERVLGGKKHITAFAPTNKAFEDLLAALGISPDDLFQDANKGLVQDILAYHITRGDQFAADVLASVKFKMLVKEYAYIRVQQEPQIGNSKYGFANITGVDIKASNGVVHVLDKVIVPRKIDLPIANPSILEIAAGNPDFSTLVAAVKFAGFESVLADMDQKTVFAPTNDAFDKLFMELGVTPAELLVDENKKLVQDILLYHLSPRLYYASTVVNQNRIKTFGREKAYIKTDMGVQIGNDHTGYANIVAVDIDASNGVVHVLDKVIIPSKLNLYPSILEIAVGNPDFSILVKAVQFAGIENKLDGKNIYTVFAPTNKAFENLLADLGISADDLFQKENKELVRTILFYHLTKGSLFAQDVLAAGRLKMRAYEYAYIRTDQGPQIGNSKYGFANITGVDIKARNGVVHVLDKVIIPKKIDLGLSKQTILEIAAGNPNFSILVKAVQFTGSEDILAGSKKLTAFAPTDEAFVKLLGKLGLTAEELFVKKNRQLIKKILYYHFVKREFYAEDVVYEEKLKTYADEYAYIMTDKGPQIGNDKYGFANIVDVDIKASNGVVHVIDEVILPSSLKL